MDFMDFETFSLSPSNTTFLYTDDYFLSGPCDVKIPGFKTVGIMVTYIMVFIFSFFGNSVVVFVVSCMKRGSTDVYLMHLAMADLIFSLTLPFWVVYIHSGWIFGNALCKILSGFQELSVYSGVFLLACISIDRYVAIVRAKRSSHNILVKVICGVVWLVAGMLSLPVAIQRESMYDDNLEEYICYENLTGESSDLWRVTIRFLRHIMGFFIPLAIILVCYSCTAVKLLYSPNQQKHKIMRVILAVVLAFILCWFPFNVTVLVDTMIRGGSMVVTTCETLYMVEKMLSVTQVLAFSHCAVNPVLYAMIGERFRNELVSVLYEHSVISERLHLAYRRGSVNSGQSRSRTTSVTM